jgi:hypothetical protein
LQAWNVIITIIDAVFTAFWVPVVAAFDLPHDINSPSGASDFAIGVILSAEILVRFHAPIVLTSTYKELHLTHPRAVAHYYINRGSFVIDVLSTVPLVFVPLLGTARRLVLIVFLLRVVRLVRVRRVIDMLFYIQMLSISGASSWRMIIGSVMSLMYQISVVTNMLACMWYWIGRQGMPSNSWMAQEYSAPRSQRCHHISSCHTTSHHIDDDAGLRVSGSWSA